MNIDSNSVLKYLRQEVYDTKNNLEKRIDRRNKLNEEIKELQQRLFMIEKLLEKALSDFNVDEATYQSVISSLKLSENQKTNESKQTIADVIHSILKEANKPLHVQEIAKLAKERYHFRAQRPETSISSALMRDKDRFESIHRGIWKIKTSLLSDDEPDTNSII
jgi:hypothetical protein